MAISNAYNTDCTEAMRTFPDKFFNLSIVDPPYGIGLIKTAAGNWGIRKENKGDIVNDWDFSRPSPEYFEQLFRVSQNQIIWGGNHLIDLFPKASPCWIVWNKQNGATYFADCELAWTSFNTAVRMISIPTVSRDRIHECQKPVALYTWLLRKYAKPGDKILDTHLGSGSSRIACYNQGYDFWGYEISAKYFNDQEVRFKKAQGYVIDRSGQVIAKQRNIFDDLL